MSNLVKGTPTDYQDCLKRIKGLIPSVQECADLLRRIKGDKLFVHGGYRTWEAFCIKELPVSKRTADRWLENGTKCPKDLSDVELSEDDEPEKDKPTPVKNPDLQAAKRDFKELKKAVKVIRQKLTEVGQSFGGERVRQGTISQLCNSLTAELRYSEPVEMCGCDGVGCEACDGFGWVNREARDR